MSQGRKKDEQNVQTPRSDKRDHRGVKKNWEMCRKWQGNFGARQEGETQLGSRRCREKEALTGLNHCQAVLKARHQVTLTCRYMTQLFKLS